MIIIGMLVTLFVAGLVLASKTDHEEWYALTVISVVVFIFVAVFGIAWYFNSVTDYSKLRAYSQVSTFYANAITMTNDVVVELDKGELINVAPSVENLRHSTLTANRIAEERDYHREMVELLSKYRVWNDSWFLRQWIAEVPDDIKAMWE